MKTELEKKDEFINIKNKSKDLAKEAFDRILKKDPVSSVVVIDYSNIKKGDYIARIEDGIAIPHDKCGYIEKVLK